MTGGVYEIVNTVSGKRYVGSAVNFHQRWAEHRSMFRRGKHHSPHLRSAYRVYGASAFRFTPLIVCAPRDLMMYEQTAIDALKPEYNAAPRAGSTLGKRHSAETRAKIAAKALGRKRSPESVEAGAAKRRGVKLAPEHAAKMLGNKHAAGLKHTEEWKQANSLRNLGVKRPKDAEYRAKISRALAGIPHSPERRAAQAAAQRGIKRGPYNLKRNSHA